MITHATRSLAYDKIKPKAPTRQEMVLSILSGRRLTASEIAMEMSRRLNCYFQRNLSAPRLNELVKQGRVRVSGTKVCGITDEKVAAYVLVEDKPIVQQSLF
jgi:hypothetical protein